jgi:hypothetical protein
VAWLAGQVFLLCLVSFLAGAAITAVALRRKPAVPAGRAEDEALPESGEAAIQDPEEELLEDPEVASATEPVIIKASKKSMRYHTPDSPYYNRVKGDLTFPSAEEAELAGYAAWNKTGNKAGTRTPAKSSS